MKKEQSSTKTIKYSNLITDKNRTRQTLYRVLTGLSAGLCNGLFGGGGGMVVVPMLTSLLGMPPQKAHATAILIILPLSIMSGLLYLSFGVVNMEIFLPVSIGVVGGGVVGALLLSKLNSKALVIIFAVLMAVAGGRMLFF